MRPASISLLLGLSLLPVSCGASTDSSLGPGGGNVKVSSGPLPFAWPPVAGEQYPDLQLLDHRGETVQLSDFAGKVILVEPIGMT